MKFVNIYYSSLYVNLRKRYKLKKLYGKMKITVEKKVKVNILSKNCHLCQFLALFIRELRLEV